MSSGKFTPGNITANVLYAKNKTAMKLITISTRMSLSDLPYYRSQNSYV